VIHFWCKFRAKFYFQNISKIQHYATERFADLAYFVMSFFYRQHVNAAISPLFFRRSSRRFFCLWHHACLRVIYWRINIHDI